mmetsp:Transcript_23743/g.36632  ORF Transcript_23743/g.36632 Transcript_23743/m.36632 type:complete len:308 (+) Transcript_23743:283-1206(+)
MLKIAMKTLGIQAVKERFDEMKKLTHNGVEKLVKTRDAVLGSMRKKRYFAFPKLNLSNPVMTSDNMLPEESYQMRHDNVEHVVSTLDLIQTEVPAVLAKEPARRAYLVEWLPCTLRDTQIELVYSTNTHGRTLERLYANCAKAKYTIMLVEVLDTGAVIGFFATDVWHRSSKVHGDGGCFLFKLSPIAKSFSWTRSSVRSDVFESTTALAEQFMMSTDTYLSMGGSPDGSCGLRLNEDLTKGHSDYSLTFENEPLAGNGMLDFEVGIVEVYHVFRPIDGKPLVNMRAGRTLETSSELNVPSLFTETT